jgi:hypothetical protein
MYQVYVFRHDYWLFVDSTVDLAAAQALAARIGGVVI